MKDPAGHREIIFREVQPFYAQRITWIVLVLFGTMVVWMAYEDLILDAAAILVYLILIGLFALTFFGRMVTEVRPGELKVRMIPFHRKARVIKPGDIRSRSIVSYSPIKDYGGWGIRIGRKGRAYMVYGRTGLKISLHDDKDLLIGTQQPDDLKGALKRAGL